MVKRTFKDLQRLYILKVYELSGGQAYKDVEFTKINEALGLFESEEDSLLEYFSNTNLFHFAFGVASLAPNGLIAAEEFMEQTYAEKELLVLSTIYAMGKSRIGNEVPFDDLREELEMSFDELDKILTELYERKKYIGNSSDATVKLSPAGLEFLQNKSNFNQNRTVNNITNNITSSNIGNFQQLTNNSSQSYIQNTQIISNPDFNEAINSIIELVKSSSLANFKKEDLISDIERIKQLGENEPSAELVEHAKSKIDYLDKAIKATDLATKVVPYISQLYAYFEGLLR